MCMRRVPFPMFPKGREIVTPQATGEQRTSTMVVFFRSSICWLLEEEDVRRISPRLRNTPVYFQAGERKQVL